jgi:membrane protein/epoxyqueuosine reductase
MTSLRAALRSRHLDRLRTAIGTLLSRDIGVVTNAIAFNFLLCLFPLLLVVAAVSQELPAGRRLSGALTLLLTELIPFEHEALLTSLRALAQKARGLEIISLVLIVWGSSGIFVPMEMALNRAWGGTPNRNFFRARFLAFVMTLACGSLALLSVALTSAARSYRAEWPTLAAYGARASALLLSYALFFLVYRFVPGSRIRSGVAARAALLAGTAWEAAKYLFVARLPAMNLKAFYGPLAFAVALILWAYLSSLILVLGALMVPAGGRAAPRKGAR